MPLECFLLNITLRDLPGKSGKMRTAFPPPPCLPHPRKDSPPPPPGGRLPNDGPPPPPLGNRTTTIHIHLQAQKLQHKTKEFSMRCIRQSSKPCIPQLGPAHHHSTGHHRGVDEHYICPRGKCGCAVKFHFRKVSKMSCHEYKGYSGSAPQHSHPHNNTVSRNEKIWVDQVPPPPVKDKGWGRTGGGV